MDRILSDKIVLALKEKFPDAKCSLDYCGDEWRLLVMAILSAQCTDERVNAVSPALFERFPTVYDFASAEICEIERYVKSCGLYHNKAKNISLCSKQICGTFGGKVPQSMDELLTLAGVGRKIANLMLGDVFGQSAIVTDTHCIRICGRLGYYDESEKRPEKIEKILIKIIPPDEQSDFCHRLVQFGREICSARAEKCGVCPLGALCNHNRKSDPTKS